ncbi:hypothetical protein ACIOZM_04105 [Pseudomonas sp. NPDC087346]|uniref:hypothetical protein n=1 Tax=Pseudomonas sp. NPDC087346 TaxID=3364438 RepID=UPI0038194C3D
MLVQPQKAIGTLALLDPEIPGAKLLPSGEWAINRAAALLNFPTQGLKVQIPVWSNKSLADKLELLLNNFVVDHQTVTQTAELTQRATLFVAPGRFQTGSSELAYRVTRFAQQPELFAPPLKLTVKLEIPAGQDTDPGQGHSNLHMEFRPAEIVQDGVDKDTAENGVDIWVTAKPGSGSNLPYPGITVGDVIIASWGGKLVESDPVIQVQIDDPLNNPIVIHISKTIILAAGDSGNEGLAVSFFVRDFADNDSEDWCKETRIVVDTGNSRLDAPILQQADGNELDLDQLNNEQLLLQVFAASPVDFKLGDIVIMHLQGTTLDGETVQVDARQSINKNPPLVVEVPMDNDGARALAKTQGVFFFDLERGGSIIQRSRGRFINIIGEPQRMAAPIVESAVSGALDPDLSNVIVRIPHDPKITPDTAIEIIWSITLADGTIFEPELDWIFPTPQEADDPDGFIVSISGPEYLKPGEGGTLQVSYNLLSEDENGEIVRRPSLPASPLNIGEPRLELVPPILLGEQDGRFEPKDLPNGISEVTCPNPVNNPTLPRDVVHWQLHDAQGALLFTDNKPLNSLSAGKPVKFPLNAAFVQQYFEAHRGEQLIVRYHIVRDATGNTSYSNPLVSTVGEPQSSKLPFATIKEAKGDQLNPGDVTDGATVEIGASAQFKTDDEVMVTVEVEGADPTPLPAYLVKSEEEDNELSSIKVPHSLIDGAEGKSIALTYTVKRKAGGIDGPAEITVYNVLNKLFPPSVVSPAADPIDSLQYPDVTIRIQDLNALDGDRARLVEVDAPVGAPQFPLVAFNSNKRVNTLLSAAFWAARHGQVVRFLWNLNRGGGQVGKSPVLTVNVLKIEDGDSRLPVPAVDGRTESELDVKLLQAAALLTVTPWTHVDGERLWLRFEGTDTKGNSVFYDDLKGEVLSTAQGLSRPVPIAWLRDLKNGTDLRITVKVNFAGVMDEAAAAKFPARIYLVKSAPPLLSENFDNQVTQYARQGESMDLPSMLITYVSGEGRIGIFGEINGHPTIPGRRSGKFLNTGEDRGFTTDQHIRIDLKSTYSRISFWHSYINTTYITLKFHGKDDTPIGSQIILGQSTSTTPFFFQYEASGITRIDFIHPWDWYALDFFEFRV